MKREKRKKLIQRGIRDFDWKMETEGG